jgi:GxxExxY protein
MILDEETDVLTGAIIGAAIEVHEFLGPGLLESVYEECLTHELKLRRLKIERQKPLPVMYKGEVLDCGYRLDLVVEERVIVEIKSVNDLIPIHEAQLLSYLKLSGIETGLLLNFNVEKLRRGIRRMKIPK